MAVPTPQDEADRLRTLHALSVMDTPPEHRFDRYTRIASTLFDAPIALVGFIDQARHWFKSGTGFGATQIPRGVSFCSYTILGDEVFVIPDTQADQRFVGNPLLGAEFNIRFYAGCPLIANGRKMGTLCIMDTKPRTFDNEQRMMLQDLADMLTRDLATISLLSIDQITGLPNRQGFETLGTQVLAMTRRSSEPVSALILTLENLNQITEQHGLEEGEEVLSESAQMLHTAFRDSDVLGYLGDGVFGVLLTGASAESAGVCLTRLDEQMHARNTVAGARSTIRYYAGYAEYRDGEHELLRNVLLDAQNNAERSRHQRQMLNERATG